MITVSVFYLNPFGIEVVLSRIFYKFLSHFLSNYNTADIVTHWWFDMIVDVCKDFDF